MLENLYTTKMSGDAKTLQKRFSKIRSKQSRKSKITAAVMAAVLAMTALFATVAMAAIDVNISDDYAVEITNYGKKLNLQTSRLRKTSLYIYHYGNCLKRLVQWMLTRAKSNGITEKL